MSFHSFYLSARQRLLANYPSTTALIDQLELDRLLSPHRLKLPRAIAKQVQAAVKAHYQLMQDSKLQQTLAEEQPWLKSVPAQTDAILMAYDFHTTADGRAFLVEVNTNASSFLLSTLLYELHGGKPQWEGNDALASLWQSFVREAGGDRISSALVDAGILEQKMYVEFLMYHDWLTEHGWRNEIVESTDLQWRDGKLKSNKGTELQFVYNRLTDFFFDEPKHETLKAAYQKEAVKISPHPWAYLLFADKARLAEMSRPGWLEATSLSPQQIEDLRAILIPTFEISQLGTQDEIWDKRKTLFFKPKRSHGSKSVYRGSSVSRKVFERLMQEEIVIQEFVPAQSWPTNDTDSYMENWKFDVRFFVYRDQIQLAVARSYQGQVTNFASQFGGLTAVEFV